MPGWQETAIPLGLTPNERLYSHKKFHAFKHLGVVPEKALHIRSDFCLYSLIHKRNSLDSLMGRDYRGFQCEIVGFSGVR